MAKKSKKEIGKAQKERELLDTLQRLQAEFENYKKRNAQEQKTFRQRAGENILTEILPIRDNFSLAIKNNKEKNDFSQGIELIYAQLGDVLKTHGVEKIVAQGEGFDPTLHEALMTKKDDAQDNNVVLEVMQERYTIHGRVLRPSKVIVNKR